MLHLEVYLPNILTDDAQSHQYASAYEPHREDQRRPARHYLPRHVPVDDIAQHHQRHHQEEQPEEEHEAHGSHAERRYAVDGKVKHGTYGIFAVSFPAPCPVVVPDTRLIAQHRNETSQEDVALLVPAQLADGTTAHQPAVGMVVHRPDAHDLHQPVEHLRRSTLEPRVGGPFLPHAIDNVYPPGGSQTPYRG